MELFGVYIMKLPFAVLLLVLIVKWQFVNRQRLAILLVIFFGSFFHIQYWFVMLFIAITPNMLMRNTIDRCEAAIAWLRECSNDAWNVNDIALVVAEVEYSAVHDLALTSDETLLEILVEKAKLTKELDSVNVFRMEPLPKDAVYKAVSVKIRQLDMTNYIKVQKRDGSYFRPLYWLTCTDPKELRATVERILEMEKAAFDRVINGKAPTARITKLLRLLWLFMTTAAAAVAWSYRPPDE